MSYHPNPRYSDDPTQKKITLYTVSFASSVSGDRTDGRWHPLPNLHRLDFDPVTSSAAELLPKVQMMEECDTDITLSRSILLFTDAPNVLTTIFSDPEHSNPKFLAHRTFNTHQYVVRSWLSGICLIVSVPDSLNSCCLPGRAYLIHQNGWIQCLKWVMKTLSHEFSLPNTLRRYYVNTKATPDVIPK